MIKTRNPMTSQSLDEKRKQYYIDSADGSWAHKSDGTKVLLKNTHIDNVEFIGGLWRVQDPFPYKIQEVRDKRFVMLKKLEHQEKNLFEFYEASYIYENCYGMHLSSEKAIVAKYETKQGTFWSYGRTIEQARAFLGIKLYDVYQCVIHAHANEKLNGKL